MLKVSPEPMTTGASLGAYLAANEYFKHPDLFRGTIPMSGSYDIRSFLDGYYDDNVYFNNPVDYLSNLNDDHYLPMSAEAIAIYIMTGRAITKIPIAANSSQAFSSQKEFRTHWICGDRM
jgi:esterase/lipase superfamily enzyme